MQLSTGWSRNYEIEIDGEYDKAPDLIDIIRAGLESEDTLVDGLIGYGICFGGFFFLLMQVVRALIFC